MLIVPTSTRLAEMGQAGLQFVEQFELQRVLANFENELLKLANEKSCKTREPEQASPAR